jgi:hypothetical protein
MEKAIGQTISKLTGETYTCEISKLDLGAQQQARLDLVLTGPIFLIEPPERDEAA